MKRLIYLITLTLVLVSCGSRSGNFSLEGRLLNLNQGEFYVYSPDGVFDGVDTIKVDGGRFAFETPCKESGTIVIVFPNYSEIPVFAEPGKSVTVKGDASHLKEIEIKGTDENELMTGFRQQLLKASPPEVSRYAEQFIMNNPESAASVYVLRKHFVTVPDADFSKAAKLTEVVYKAQPKNGDVARIDRYVKMMRHGGTGAGIPSFSAQDINGVNVSDADLKGKVAVVYTWAGWSYDSRIMRDRLNRLKNEYGNRLVLLGINLDASRQSCMATVRNDSTSSVNICDQMMFDSPLLDKFAFGSVADNIVFNAQGRIVERGLGTDELETKLKILLN